MQLACPIAAYALLEKLMLMRTVALPVSLALRTPSVEVAK
jgi:hypothetical protein